MTNSDSNDLGLQNLYMTGLHVTYKHLYIKVCDEKLSV